MLNGWLDVNFNIGLGDKAKTLLCEKTHKEFHEYYDEIVGDGGYGPYWENGYRCKKCGRHWPDPERIKSEQARFAYDQMAQWHVMFGTADRHLMSLWGDWYDPYAPDDYLGELYNGIRRSFREGNQYAEGQDIGPIEDKWFVFDDEMVGHDIITVENKEANWKPDGTQDFHGERNLMNNWPGLQYPMHPEAKKVWDKYRIPYTEFMKRLKEGEEKWKNDPPPYPS